MYHWFISLYFNLKIMDINVNEQFKNLKFQLKSLEKRIAELEEENDDFSNRLDELEQ